MRAGKMENGKSVDLMHVFEGVGALKAGKLTQLQLQEIEDNACPTCGSCSWHVHRQFDELSDGSIGHSFAVERNSAG